MDDGNGRTKGSKGGHKLEGWDIAHRSCYSIPLYVNRPDNITSCRGGHESWLTRKSRD